MSKLALFFGGLDIPSGASVYIDFVNGRYWVSGTGFVSLATVVAGASGLITPGTGLVLDGAHTVTFAGTAATLLKATSGSVVIDATSSSSSPANFWRVIGDSASEATQIFQPSGNNVQVGTYNGSSLFQRNMGTAYTWSGGVITAHSWDSAPTRVITGGGGKAWIDTSAADTVTTPAIGASANGAEFFVGTVRTIAIYNSKISNTLLQRATYPIATKPPRSKYLAAFFDPNDDTLVCCYSQDGVSFNHYNNSYNPSPDPGVRDPTIFRRLDGVLIAAYTNVALTTDITSTFSMAKSVDNGLNWTRVGTVDCSALTGTTGHIWAPQFFVDGSNTYLIFCYEHNQVTEAAFQVGYVQASDATLLTYGTATSVTGSAIPANVIDPFIIKRSGTYYLWYVKVTGSFPYTETIEVASSSSPLSGYNTAFGTGDWMGIGLSKEAPHVLSLGGTSWRLYYDDYGSGGNRESFVESTDDWTTWGAVHDNGANQGVTDSASHNNVVAHGEVSVNSYSFP